MYDYVKDKEFLRMARNCCSDLMHQLEEELRNNGINSQFFLVGSGSRNMIMQNGDKPIDFDYNLNILDCDDFNDGRYIKETVRKVFNKVMRNNGLRDVSDSKIPLTTHPIWFNRDETKKFTMDVCIVRQIDGKWARLKHKKTGYVSSDEYYWNIAPNSSDYVEKVKLIKSIPGWWEKVRSSYKIKKNMYLTRNAQDDHPSFICYIETVNEIYNQMKQKGLLRR